MGNYARNPGRKKRPFVSYTLFAFTDAQLRDLLAACSSMEDYIMIMLSCRYGFRREDVVGIKISDVNTKDNTITFYEHKKDRNRTIPIEKEVSAELLRYINTTPADKRGGTLFSFKDGSTAWRHLQDACYIANIPIPEGRTGRPFHSCRGYAVKYWEKKGWSINEVAALIGDTPETVMKHYLTVSPSELTMKMAGETT